jgi:single-strand DNA-binding protein
MNNLNSILLEGNLTRDPVVKTTAKGTTLCTFTVASNRYYKKSNDEAGSGFEKETSFFDVEAWAKLAESCASLGRKGRGVRVAGRLKQDRWEDAEGKAHSKIYIVAEHVEYRPETQTQQQQDPEPGDITDIDETEPVPEQSAEA